MNENKFLNETPEQVVIFPKPRIIRINTTEPARAYGIFDSQTGTQVSEFKKGTDGQVEFADLDPNRHYDVGAIEVMGDEKPYFAINWTKKMKDDTDTILKNSDNLPVEFPQTYVIINNNDKNNVFDIADDKGEIVGQVINLSQTKDKPKFEWVKTFKMKDETNK